MDIRYTSDHEWVAVENQCATVGITDFAQSQLGDLVFVQLPEIGTKVSKGDAIAVIESVKAASDIYAPLSGRIVEVNAATVQDPALVTSDPLGAGWLFKIELQNPKEFNQLLVAAAYREIAR